MGSRMVKLEFTPGENEQIETEIRLPEEKRSIIHGVVYDYKNKPAKDAVVKLFIDEDCDDRSYSQGHKDKCALKPITHTFTDECGHFLFGPLLPHKHYTIKVWVNDIKIRVLNIHNGHDDHNEYDSDDKCESECPDDDYDPDPCPVKLKNDHGSGHKPKY